MRIDTLGDTGQYHTMRPVGIMAPNAGSGKAATPAKLTGKLVLRNVSADGGPN